LIDGSWHLGIRQWEDRHSCLSGHPVLKLTMSILDKIVASKHREIAEAKSRTSYPTLESQLAICPIPRPFRARLMESHAVSIIAEVKKASPSAGLIREDFDPVAIAKIYETHGAAAISVLTDEPFFQGRLDYLTAIRKVVSVPLLRKDFILDEYQILEARVAGADAVLLIAEILDDSALPTLLRETHRLGMEALVEIYDLENLSRVIDSGATIIGVNNRDLRTFETKLEHAFEVAAKLPPGKCLVSESGIRSHADILRLQAAGVHAVLIGESIMREPDIGAKLDELRGVRGD